MVEKLYKKGLLANGTASQAIGYKELTQYIENQCSLNEAVEKIKLSSRRYAKRQLTWFRHEEGARVIYMDRPGGEMKNADELLSEALEIASELRLEYEREEKKYEG